MRINLTLLVTLFASLILSVTPIVAAEAAGADRFALVIGNAKYPDADTPLKEPVNDAHDVADELKRDGFNVDVGENMTGEAMRRAFDRLYGRIKPGSVALIFFSGFGIQSSRQSFLIPVDAQIWTEPDVRRDGISLENVLGEINNRGAGVKLALIDASRRNPFERRFRSFSAGLAPVTAPNGTLVMYSAALGAVISDNGGDHSLFVQELLKEVRVPGLMAEEAFERTRVGVSRASRRDQVPSILSSLAEDFSFTPGVAGAASGPDVAALSPPIPEPAPHAEPPAPKPVDVAVPPPAAAVTTPAVTPALTPALPPHPTTPAAAVTTPAATATAATPVPPASPAPVTPPAAKMETKSDGATALALADDPTIKSLTAKLADNPDDQNALYRRGQVYASKGAYNLAIKDFDDTLRLNPKDVEALNNRCWTRTVTGDLQAALKDCNEALRLRPNFADALDSRGLLNLKSGQNKNAIADFDAALKIKPEMTSSLYGRGLAKLRIGLSEGERDISDATSRDQDIVKDFAGYGVR